MPNTNKKIGPNAPCPCGSGKKYKKCCAQNNLQQKNPLQQTFTQAQYYFTHDQYEAASQLYRKILAIQPEHTDALHYLGLSEIYMGQFESGLQNIRTSLQRQPDDVVFLSNAGFTMIELRHYKDAEKYLCRALAHEPGNVDARYNLCILFNKTRRYFDAKPVIKKLAREYPQDAEIQSLYARILMGLDELVASARQYETALKINPHDLDTNLEYSMVLDMLGQQEKLDVLFDKLIMENPDNTEILYQLASYCETNSRLDDAERWLSLITTKPNIDIGRLNLSRAKLAARRKQFQKALELLHQIDPVVLQDQYEISYYFILGNVQDKLGHHVDAFAAFHQGNELRKRTHGYDYDIKVTNKQIQRSNRIYTRENIERWSASSPQRSTTGPEPLFIVGFLRSGSTLLEQMLASHSGIDAGGEFNFIELAERSAAVLLGSEEDFPESMLALNKTNKKTGLEKLKSAYLQQLEKLNKYKGSSNTNYWVTDKCLFNSLELSFIYLLFPQSPIFHVIRHPLDVCLSTYFTNFSAGHPYADDLVTTAQFYMRVLQQVEDTLEQIPLNYHIVHYEELIQSPREYLAHILATIGVPWEDACLEFYKTKRVAHTASYAQVNQPLYSSSMNRFQHYRKFINDIIPILQPAIERYGYSIEQGEQN